MRRHAKALAAVTALLSTLAIGVATSSAAETRAHLGNLASQPNPHAIAIDQSNGDVYVIDVNDNAVSRYDSAGNAVGFSALNGSNTINGSEAGSDNDITPQGGLALDSSSQVAIDFSGTATDGNVYVANSNHSVVSVFDGTGAYAGQLTGVGTNVSEPTQTWGDTFAFPCGIAAAANGDLYVATAINGQIDRYAPTGAIPTDADLEAQITELPFGTCGLGLDSANNPHAATNAFGEVGVLSKYAAADFGTAAPAGTVIDPAATAVFVDPSNGDVFASNGPSATQYDASGAQIVSFGQGVLTDSHGIAIDRSPTSSNGAIYASSSPGGGGFVARFGEIIPVYEVAIGAATDIEAQSATLHGVVTPDGALTDYRFEYRRQGSEAWTATPIQSAGAGTDPVEVEAVLEILPASTYEARLRIWHRAPFEPIPADPAQILNSDTVSFSTPTVAPVVETRPAAEVTDSSARIRARINPAGAQTTYYFQWGTTASYGRQIPLSPAAIEPGVEAVAVSALIDGLNPGTTYHYRVVAANSVGQSDGGDRSFNTESGSTCSNEAIRIAQSSTHLSDCRAYEMVSPLKKGNADVAGDTEAPTTQVSTTGDAIAYSSSAAFGDATGGALPSVYRASRGSGSWHSTAISAPSESSLLSGAGLTSIVDALSADLSAAVIHTTAQLTPAATPRASSIYTRDIAPNAYTLHTPGIPTGFATNSISYVQAVSSDFRHVAFSLPAALTPDAPDDATDQLYVSDGESLEFASYLPGPGMGIPSQGYAGNRLNYGIKGALSDDGSRVFFQPVRRGGAGGLYMRDLDTDQTTEIAPAPEGEFVAADPTGSRVLYLTTDSLNALRLRDMDTGTVRKPDDLAGETVRVDQILEANRDLSSVYLVAPDLVLDGQEPPPPGYNPEVDSAVFRWEPLAERITHVAYLIGQSFRGYAMPDLDSSPAYQQSPSGNGFAFITSARVTGFDSQGMAQVYHYNADTGGLSCVSCPPESPSGSASLYTLASITTDLQQEPLLAKPGSITADGRSVFFETPERLLPADSNGRYDVYLWRSDGSLSLLSGGRSQFDSRFVGASPDGRNAFFVTRERLTGHDTDVLADVYVARVEGGYPEPLRRVECLGDSCQPPPIAPNDPTPASANFQGAGNVQKAPRCARGKRAVKQRGKTRCVSRKAKKRSQSKRADAKPSTRRHG